MSDAPRRSGLLADEPLPQLFGALARQRQTCVVRLNLSSGPAEVYLTDGQAVSVELPGAIDRLGELLTSGGAIDAETLRRTLAAPRLPGQRYGRLLVESGLVPEQKLQAALRLQIRRRLHRLFFAEEGDFVVEVGQHHQGQGPEQVSVDLRPSILLGVRSAWSEARYGSGLPTSRLKLVADAAELSIYQLQPAELALLAPLRQGPCTVTQLVVAAHEGGAAQVRPTVYALYATGAVARDGGTAVMGFPADRSGPSSSAIPVPIDRAGPPSSSAMVGSGGAPSRVQPEGGIGSNRTTADRTSPGYPILERSGPGSSPSLPPPAPAGRAVTTPPLSGAARSPSSTSATDLATERALGEKRAAVDTQDYYEVLGVSRDASKAEVKAAYLEAARLYHPDRLANAGVLHMREAAEYIFRRVSEAHSTLADDERRAAYLEKVSISPEARAAHEKAQRVVAAEMALMEGDVALKRRDFPTAIERLGEAVQLNPDEGEAIALLAWARFSAGQATLLDQRPEFERAVAKAPQCARAHFYLGMVRKQARESQAAINSFRRAVELDPRLAEAASELRVLSLRATRELPTMQRPKSLLDRFLKK